MNDNHHKRVKRLQNLFMLYGTVLGSLIATSEYKDDKVVDTSPEYNYAMDYYYNHSFDSYLDDSVKLYFVPVDDSLIYMLPSHITRLNLDSLFFINSLTKLPSSCPNL